MCNMSAKDDSRSSSRRIPSEPGQLPVPPASHDMFLLLTSKWADNYGLWSKSGSKNFCFKFLPSAVYSMISLYNNNNAFSDETKKILDIKSSILAMITSKTNLIGTNRVVAIHGISKTFKLCFKICLKNRIQAKALLFINKLLPLQQRSMYHTCYLNPLVF